MVDPLITATPSAYIPLEVSAACSASLAETGANFGQEKRKDPRYATCDIAEVSLPHMAGLRLHGTVRDVSRNGMCVELHLPVSVGSRLKISLCKKAIVFAVARYCRQTKNTYQVGVEIENVYYPGCTTISTLPLEPLDSPSAQRSLARSIVLHHTAYSAGDPDRLLSRLCPVSDGQN